MPTTKRLLVCALAATVALLLLAGCAMPASTNATMGSAPVAAAPVPVAGEITVEGVRARPAPLEGGNGAAYMTVLNGTDKPVRFASAAGDVAANIELHETLNDAGVMKMVPQPDGFEIPAGGSVELKPGGKHVMLLGLTKPLMEGDVFSLTLNFDDGKSIDLSVPVVAMDAMNAMPAQPAMGGSAEITGTNMMTASGALTGTNMMTGTQP